MHNRRITLGWGLVPVGIMWTLLAAMALAGHGAEAVSLGDVAVLGAIWILGLVLVLQWGLRWGRDHRLAAGVIESINGVVWEADARTLQFTYLSPQVEGLFGYPRGEWLAQPTFWREHLHPSDRDAAVEHLRGVAARGEKHEFEYRLMATDGRAVWVRDLVAVELRNGRPATLRGLMVDVTALKRAEEVLRHREHELVEVQALAHLGSYSWNLETGALEWSDELHRVWGLAAPLSYEKVLAHVHPDDRERVIQAGQKVTAAGDLFEVEYRIVRPDGQVRYLYDRARVHRDAAGRPVGLFGTALDVTQRREAEAALRESEERFRQIIETSGAGYFRIDLNRNFSAVNTAWLRMHGLDSADEIIGRHMTTYHAETEPAAAEAAFQRELAGGKMLAGHGMHRCRDGSLRHHAFTVNAVRHNGEAVGIEGFLIDTTELRRAQSDFEMLFRGMLEGFAVHEIICDAAGVPIDYRFLQVNPAFEQLTGLKAAAVVGRTVREIVPSLEPEWIDIYGRVALTGAPASITAYSHGLGRHLQVNAFRPMPGRFACVFVDVTARLHAEERLREQAALLDVTQDAVVVVDTDWRIAFWNRGAETIYGWKEQEALGRVHPELVGLPEPPEPETLYDQLHATGSWSGERRHVAKSGREVVVQIRATVIREEPAAPGKFLFVATDVSEAKQLEVQFLRAQRLESLGALASGVAHDLNNVLTPIVMGVGMLHEPERTPQEVATLQMIEDAARRGADIVRQLLLFGRGSDAPKEEMDLHIVIYDLSRILKETFPRNLTIVVTAPSDLWRIKGDPTQLHQVLLNLCVNARDAMPDGGALTVVAENLVVDAAFAQQFPGARAGPYLVLRVIDSGCGIPAENLGKVFDPFFTTKPVGHGTGLGLPTVLGIIKGHGGFLDLRSRPGHGTEFLVYLPALETQGQIEAVTSSLASLEGNGELVLVVDDEPAVRQILQQVLKRNRYRVVSAADGAEGVAVFAQHADDVRVVVTDLMMPVMDGVQMIRALRRVVPEIPIVALSGLHGHGAELHKEGYRSLRLLAKPFASERLLLLLRESLAEAAARPSAASGAEK